MHSRAVPVLSSAHQWEANLILFLHISNLDGLFNNAASPTAAGVFIQLAARGSQIIPCHWADPSLSGAAGCQPGTAGSKRRHMESVTLSPRQGAEWEAVPGAIPSLPAQIQLQPCCMYSVLVTLSLGLGAYWCSSSPGTHLDRMSTGRENWSVQVSPKNNAGHESLAFVLFKSPFQNKEQKGWHERNI